MIDPRHMTLKEWADAVILSVQDTWSFGRLDREEDWQAWAKTFVGAAGYSQLNVPDPYEFDDWRVWAMRAYPMLEVNV